MAMHHNNRATAVLKACMNGVQEAVDARVLVAVRVHLEDGNAACHFVQVDHAKPVVASLACVASVCGIGGIGFDELPLQPNAGRGDIIQGSQGRAVTLHFQPVHIQCRPRRKSSCRFLDGY